MCVFNAEKTMIISNHMRAKHNILHKNHTAHSFQPDDTGSGICICKYPFMQQVCVWMLK